MTHSFTCIRLSKDGKRKTDTVISLLDRRTITTPFKLVKWSLEKLRLFLYMCQMNDTHTRTYAIGVVAWGVPSVGKKGGKGDGLMRKQGVAEGYFTRQRNLSEPKLGFACGIKFPERKTWCHIHTHTPTILCLVAVAPQSYITSHLSKSHTAVLYHTCLYMVIARAELMLSTTNRHEQSKRAANK